MRKALAYQPMAKQKFKFVGFVPYTVDKAIKAATTKRVDKGIGLLDCVAQFSETGYKLSIVLDEETNTYVITAFDPLNKTANKGLILSARHSDLAKASCLLLTLHLDVFNENWKSPDNSADQYEW